LYVKRAQILAHGNAQKLSLFHVDQRKAYICKWVQSNGYN